MKLKKLEVSAFAGINPNSPIVIDFTQSKFVEVNGDMGVGKTSLLNALLVACGQLSKDSNDKALVNKDSGKIDINFSFVGKDKYNYEVRCTKSSFSLTYEGEAVPEPITKMKELLGVVGVSPMDIKFKPLKEIVKWLAGYSNKSAEEFEGQLAKYKSGIKSARETRSAANKSVKGLTEYLDNEDLFINWEESEKRYSKEPDIKTLSAELDKAGKKSDTYIRAEEKLKRLKQDRPSIVSRIEELKKELAQKENELVEHDRSVAAGEKYIEENKSDKKQYDDVKKKYDSAAQDVVNYNKWQEVKRKKKEKDEFEDLSQKADAQEKKLLQSVKELQAEILPDIKGLELVTEDTHEDGVIKKEGLYVNGKNTAQLSESEFWAFVMQVWKKYKVKIVVIDNYQSLGSKAVSILEGLSKDGAYILVAQMNREQKTLQINY
jgi:DNA repair exonuclease SbcCD ATPase subunit